MFRETANVLASVICFQRRIEPWTFEALLVVCSAWAGKCLLLPPSNFGRYSPDSFGLMAKLEVDEHRWATFALAAATLEAIGLATMYWPKLAMPSFQVRCIGIVMICVFWLVIGVSFLVASADLVASIPSIMLGIGSAWILLRLPSTPRYEPR